MRPLKVACLSSSLGFSPIPELDTNAKHVLKTCKLKAKNYDGINFAPPLFLNINQLHISISFLLLLREMGLIMHFTITVIVTSRSWEEMKNISLDAVEKEH